jgi:hypothetical protein
MMRDHGASAIVPLNRCMIVGIAAFSLFMLPWWITVIVLGLGAALWRVASDQYGGMQLCLLLLPGVFLGLATVGKRIEEAQANGRTISIVEAAVNTFGPAVLFVLLMVGAMAMTVAAALALDWLKAKW